MKKIVTFVKKIYLYKKGNSEIYLKFCSTRKRWKYRSKMGLTLRLTSSSSLTLHSTGHRTVTRGNINTW